MKISTTVLLVGLLAFAVLGLVWLFSVSLVRVCRNEPIPPARYAIQVSLFAAITLIWLSIIVLHNGGELDDMLCIWTFMVPAIAFGGFMAYLGNRKRNLHLQDQETSEDTAPER